MSLETQTLEFGEFLLDLKEKVLLRNGERLPINPKTFQLLVTLLENHGHLVEKDRLMKTLWPDSFVEEANLAFTVSLLRKTLGDDTRHPRYIETVPKRGYRFVGKVGKGDQPNRSKPAAAKPQFPYFLLAGAVVLIIGIFGIGFVWFMGGSQFTLKHPKLTRLTSSGKVTNAAITPDGKNIVFAQKEDIGEALWVRQIDTGSQTQVLPAQEVEFVALTVSPDSNYAYYSVFAKNKAVSTLSRVPLRGGGTTEPLSEIAADISVAFSPDGKRFAFTENISSVDETYLKTADADGSNQKVLITTKGDKRRFPIFRASPVAWTPDGEAIACAVQETDENGSFFKILLVDPSSGSEKYLSEKRWNHVDHIVWIDAWNVAIVESEPNSPIQQLWRISRKTGEARQLTNDLNGYEWLGSANGNILTVQKKVFSSLHVADFTENSNTLQPKQIFSESNLIDNVAWSNDERIFYNSWTSGTNEIWQINPDGTAPQQLTTDSSLVYSFAVSPVDNTIVFPSIQNAKISLSAADSKGIHQLTDGTYDFSPSFSPNGKTVVFQKGSTPATLWSVEIEGNQPPVQVTGYFATDPSVSPDGRTIAYHFMDYGGKDPQWKLGLIDAATHRLLNKLKFPVSITQRTTVWHPTDNRLTLVFNRGENVGVLLMSPNGEFQTIDNIAVGKIASFAWSPDGSRLAFVQNFETSDVILLGEY